MPGTPEPTVEQIFDALPLLGCRLSLVQKELVRRLRILLPQAIAEANMRAGKLPDKGIPQVAKQDIRVAPSSNIDRPTNSVLVALSEDISTQGSRAFKGEVEIAIYSIEPYVVDDEQVGDTFDRAKLILACLYHCLLGCHDLENRRLWKLLTPTSVSLLPTQFEKYSGSVVRLRMTQPPGPSNWI